MNQFLRVLLLLLVAIDGLLAASWVKVWEDEFDGTGLPDAANWAFEEGCNGWGNQELECYTSNKTTNARRENGHLVINVHVEHTNDKEYTSARIHSKHAWTYGRFEVRAKLPKGKHLWPAIWMMPKDSVYGGWAASGEIDIMEYRGQKVDTFSGTIHYGGPWPNNSASGSGDKTFSGKDFSADFHTYALEWDGEGGSGMRWYLDGTEWHSENLNRSFWSGKGTNPYTGNKQPFDKDFYFILNVAVGGTFFPSATYGSLTVAEAQTWAKPTMEVDWVRVSKWQ